MGSSIRETMNRLNAHIRDQRDKVDALEKENAELKKELCVERISSKEPSDIFRGFVRRILEGEKMYTEKYGELEELEEEQYSFGIKDLEARIWFIATDHPAVRDYWKRYFIDSIKELR